ncbi:dTDP-4-dehydrorhamnose 3,5-epimerase [Edwardsiella tarda]|uniref:dTDP-4-dehydrorhamnose 3,5-epimerase n=1 Tax=Edwardsiella tarda TaxID=636 RepID=UPI000D514AB4|nr:dTDP-4-dehydrorhamnose 3,5-epimerase [Edwardsiella tarda]UCQ10405.1 dTDP-4-dehydrorhamnose 3,5-epimerase [Edwardsiella tarda]
MKVIKTTIPDVLIFEPTVFGDERGFFFESFNHKVFEDAIGHSITFVQDNHSKSSRNVLRGLHYQIPPYAQGKLVRCIVGEVFDVAVDIRKTSSTFGQWVGVNLSADNKRQLWIPEGFAHGFQVISDNAEFVYKTTNYYNINSERSILWNDKFLSIAWHDLNCNIKLSKKDMSAVNFESADYFY